MRNTSSLVEFGEKPFKIDPGFNCTMSESQNIVSWSWMSAVSKITWNFGKVGFSPPGDGQIVNLTFQYTLKLTYDCGESIEVSQKSVCWLDKILCRFSCRVIGKSGVWGQKYDFFAHAEPYQRITLDVPSPQAHFLIYGRSALEKDIKLGSILGRVMDAQKMTYFCPHGEN